MRFLRRLVALVVSLSLGLSLAPASGLAATVVPVPFTTPAPASMRSVTFADANHGWITGSYSATTGEVGFILATSDGGATWKQIKSQADRDFSSAALTPSGVGIAASDWAPTVSRFDGASWSSPSIDASGAQIGWIGGVAFAGSNVGALVGQRTALAGDAPMKGQPAALYTTANGGQTWTKAWQGPDLPPAGAPPNDDPSADAQLTAVDFARGTTNGWAIGYSNSDQLALNSGITMRTTDGAAWTPGTMNNFKTLSMTASGIAAVSASEAWAIGGNASYGAVAHTTNGGTTWSAVTTLAASATKFKPMTDLDVTSGGVVVATAAGSAPAIYRNDGTGWKQAYSSTSALRSIAFVDGGPTGWAVGENGTVLKTTNAGATWQLAPAKVAKTVTSTTITPSSTIVGYGGSVSLTASIKNSDGAAVAGKSVRIETSTDKVNWTYWKTLTASTGAVSFSVAPANKTYYRARFLGDADYVASTSAVPAAVTPKVYLTTPTGASTYLGRTFTSASYLKPRHTAGTYPVKIMCYRYERQSNGTYKWVYRKSFLAKAANYSSYTKVTAAVKLPYRGKWRIRAYHADAQHYATYSTYRYLSIK